MISPRSSSHMRKHSFAKQVLTYYYLMVFNFCSLSKFSGLYIQEMNVTLVKDSIFCLSWFNIFHFLSAKKVETLLAALGRADNAASAMKVLGPHAGKVKQAKEAVPWATDTVDAGVYKPCK